MNAHASLPTYAITEHKTETHLSLKSVQRDYEKSQLVYHYFLFIIYIGSIDDKLVISRFLFFF